jgi:hypothetical protein
MLFIYSVILYYLFNESFVKLILSIIFVCMVSLPTYACIYSISFVSTTIPLYFRYEPAVMYIRIRVLNWLLSDPL